jgi:methylmalonyl-CoA mutase
MRWRSSTRAVSKGFREAFGRVDTDAGSVGILARMTEPLALASEFPAATREQWLKLVEGVLKDRPFDTLVSETYDGLRIPPLSPRAADARPIAGRTTTAPWQLLQRVDHPDPAAANAEVLHDLESGASGLSLIFVGAVGAHGFGLDTAGLERALEGVHLDAGIAIEIDAAASSTTVAGKLASLAKHRADPSALDIRFGIDPLSAVARHGSQARPWPDAIPAFCRTVGELAAYGFKGPFAVADGRVIHAAGGSEAQELAFALGTAVAYLRALEARGVALDAARRMLFFRLAADADQFLTTAKFRALRKLWARVEDACSLTPEPAFVSAETAWRMMTRRDPHVNMLRTTVAALAAAVGGANAITVLPYTAALGLPDRFARRVARNTQLILAEEANLAKVLDPAAGSGALEDLTDQLCRAAWTLFQEIEAAGGIAEALTQGLIQRKVAEVRAVRERAIAHRRDGLTGTSEFPNLAEAPVAVLDVPPSTSAATASGNALAPVRLAEPFEALRDRSDKILTETGARPKVFLANLGTPSDFLARATFARNFFEAGGIEAITNDGFAPAAGSGTDLDALTAAFRASGAKLACLCGSDDAYRREAVEAAGALSKVGKAHIYLAGRAGAHEAALQAVGEQRFIYAGCDALASLKAAYAMIA